MGGVVVDAGHGGIDNGMTGPLGAARKVHEKDITLAVAQDSIQRKALDYDATGDAHYDVASAFIKSIRGSDPDAALHYLARMLEAGEDPRFVARRLMIAASEDIGMADPTVLQTAVAAGHAVAIAVSSDSTVAACASVRATSTRSSRAGRRWPTASSCTSRATTPMFPACTPPTPSTSWSWSTAASSSAMAS